MTAVIRYHKNVCHRSKIKAKAKARDLQPKLKTPKFESIQIKVLANHDVSF